MSAAELGRAVKGPRAEITPAGANVLLSGVEAANFWWSRNGKSPPAGWREATAVLLEVAIAAGMRPMPPGRPPVESAATFADPITARQAAFLLGCSPRNVRYLCQRETITSAQRRSGQWIMEKAEVVALAEARRSTRCRR